MPRNYESRDKKELVHTRPWPTLADLKKETADWIEN